MLQLLDHELPIADDALDQITNRVGKHRKVIISLVSVAGTSAVDPQRSSLSETSDLLALSVTRALLQRSEKWRFAVWFEL